VGTVGEGQAPKGQNQAMKALWIALANLRRMFRARANLFFVFVFPMLLILVLGATFGGSSSPRLGVVSARSGPLGADLVRQLDRTPHLQVVSVADPAALLTGVQRGNYAAGIVIPAGYDAAVRAGRSAAIRYLARPDQGSQQLGETVRGAVAKQAALLGAARFAVAQHAAPSFAAGLAQASRISPSVPAVTVTQTTAGTAVFPTTLGQFTVGAWTELVLFLFLIALTGAVGLIESRRLGLPQRMLATPTSPAAVIAGETLGRVLIACVQALVIILGSALLFGVRWGQPAGVAAVVILYACAGAGAGTFVGTLFRNEQQASGISLLLGLGLGALGGCMVPLEVFPPTMKKIAHLTPQAWGNDAFDKLVAHGASITGILPQLGVLALFAVVLLTLAAWRLRRVLVT
jgi:ABC-2 type transport system permease protein